MRNKNLYAHLSMLAACAGWGLMAPLGKDAMTHGISGMDMVTFRVTGAALLFWICSLFVGREHVPARDLCRLFFAGLFGLVLNQCCFTIGLSLTSPVNASIVTTGMPVFAMLLAALVLKEPLTWKKAFGVFLGCTGAVILILGSARGGTATVGDIRGDVLCLVAQFSFALYLSLFSPLVKRYSLFTVNKWMFTYAALLILPFTFRHVSRIAWAEVPVRTWFETAYVVVVGTFLCYIFMMNGQKHLRPTLVSVYNYVQPVVSVTVSLLLGLSLFGWMQGLAVLLVFAGVWMVTKSRAKADNPPDGAS